MSNPHWGLVPKLIQRTETYENTLGITEKSKALIIVVIKNLPTPLLQPIGIIPTPALLTAIQQDLIRSFDGDDDGKDGECIKIEHADSCCAHEAHKFVQHKEQTKNNGESLQHFSHCA